MALYSQSIWLRQDFTSAPAVEIRTSAIQTARLMEIAISCSGQVGTSGTFAGGIGRPATMGTPVFTYNFKPLNPDESSVSQTVMAFSSPIGWVTPPTAPTQFFRRFYAPVAAGARHSIVFHRGLLIPVSSSLVLWCISQSNATPFCVDVTIDE